MKLTTSQRAAIEHRGSSLLVAASAGSGKTEVLARRCAALIADPRQPASVDRLLVVTFTRAAAAELRVRVARMLRETAETTGDERLRAHLRRQEVLVEAADIGTIDAWCGRIVREHFAEAGVDAEFATLSEEEALLLRGEVLDELFVWIYTADDPLAAAAREWLRRGARPDDAFLRGLIVGVSAFREHLVDPRRWFERESARQVQPDDVLRGDAARVLGDRLLAELRFQYTQVRDLLADPQAADAASALRWYQERITEWGQRLAEATRGVRPSLADDLLALVTEIAAGKLPSIRGLPAHADQSLSEVRERWFEGRLKKRWDADSLRGLLADVAASSGLGVTLLRLEARYQELLESAKRQRARYEFGDVLRMALDLLGESTAAGPRKPTAIAQRLRQRYAHVLVDEFQDTSPVQVEILRLVTRDEPGTTNGFFVGDIKQSIYAFRQAEPRLFAGLAAAFESGEREGRVQPLSDNFRSHGRLLDGLNGLFAMLFEPALGGSPYGGAETLRAGRTEIANPTLDAAPRIALHLLEAPRGRRGATGEEHGEEVPLERIEREAIVAAREVQALLERGVQIPERKPTGEVVLRPLRLSDVVILLRSARQNAGIVATVLRECGLSCVAAGRESILDALEVLDLRDVLALLANRRQDVALAAYLRGPLVGLSPAEMLRIRQASAEADYYDAVEFYRRSGSDAALKAKLDAADAQLDRWWVTAREQELPAVLQRILRDGGLALFARALPGGEHRVAVLRALERLAAEFAAGGQYGVVEFLEYLDALREQQLEAGASVTAGEDVVRVMTIHGAKGLEFPVVFLLNTGAQFNRERLRRPLQCDEYFGVGLRFLDYPARKELVSPAHVLSKYAALERDLEEELRLLYVATTRARERLVIVGHTEPGTWADLSARYARRGGKPALISRLSADSMLAWVLMGAAAGGLHNGVAGGMPLLHLTTCNADAITAASAGAPPDESHVVEPMWTDEDEEWVARARMLLTAPVQSTRSALPAVLSVSTLKELARGEGGADIPAALDAAVQPLTVPCFAGGAAIEDGRAIGVACHQFLRFADLRRMDSAESIRAQVDALVAAGRLTAGESELLPVADLAWLGQSAEGRLLGERAAAIRRETPFVYTLPVADIAGAHGRDPSVSADDAVIIRGVIDCLIETDTGLVLLDYKTDAVSNEQELTARVAGYTLQLQMYAHAAAAIFDHPVTRAALVFLRLRRVVDVPLAPLALPAALIAELGSATSAGI